MASIYKRSCDRERPGSTCRTIAKSCQRNTPTWLWLTLRQPRATEARTRGATPASRNGVPWLTKRQPQARKNRAPPLCNPPGSTWHITYRDYRFKDDDGRRVTVKGCPDKSATQRQAYALETEAANRRRGLTDPRTEATAAHEARPLGEHLDA